MPSSAKEDDQEKEEKQSWSYDGSEEEWDSFDRRIRRYMRKKYGPFGEKLWLGQLPKITSLNGAEWNTYCEDVWESIELHDCTRAKQYWRVDSGFWDKRWQEKWRKRQYGLLKDYIEEHSKDSAETAVINYEGGDERLREYLYWKFDSGSWGDIQAQAIRYRV